MEDEEFVGCISCMNTNDLYDLFATYTENTETYAKLFETCFELKVPNHLKYICAVCAETLDKSSAFKDRTAKTISMLQDIKDEEYLDETILEEAESNLKSSGYEDEDYLDDDLDDEHAIQALDETTCIYCDLQLPSVPVVQEHIRTVHELEPRTGLPLRQCTLCGIAAADPKDHKNRCHSGKSDIEERKYPCHFCDNIYVTKKACFTHLRMKHGLKLCNEQPTKLVTKQRKKCHMCDRDFSQKQILNKHLWKAHGIEVEKRKAFICPLCDARVSYGSGFSAHLLHAHRVHEQVEQLEFRDMDDFMLFKSAIQEETKFRFRKTTASKQTIEGIRSHYMCSQSGVYVYQGKGKRPAPERQIYKTGKACPAHMIVTETMDRVLLTFFKTHVGHGPCPYFEPREPKKLKSELSSSSLERASFERPSTSNEQSSVNIQNCSADIDTAIKLTVAQVNDGGIKAELEPKEECVEEYIVEPVEGGWMCDACGMSFGDATKFRDHAEIHGLHLFPCQYCDHDFQNLDAWTRHVRVEHNMASLH